MRYLAHRDRDSGREQPLIEHLTTKAERARAFANAFGAGDEAYRCGMLHDIGKYSVAFQRRLEEANMRVDHSTAGAIEAFGLRDVPTAFCVAGHHCGLPDRGSAADSADSGTLLARVQRTPGKETEDYSAYKNEVVIPQGSAPAQLVSSAEDGFFYVHMLYSCLVDADWLDTEDFMKDGAVRCGTGAGMEELSAKVDGYVSKWWGSTEPLNVRRCGILRELMEKGERGRGLYTLTVPTGGGKTVSSMAFALRHALKNGLRRVIYVIPYTSIIEQTADVFEEIFGLENVVAHYANVEYDTDENGALSDIDRRRYLAAENWDAPIILTTSVQFFESVFGNRSSRCRKLHNIADSAIIFDEAQMLPTNYIVPCVWAMTELVRNYGCTAVLCTATQPPLGRLIEKYMPGGAVELCSRAEENYEAFRRVTYKYEGTLSDEELAERLAAEAQALCVVNSRAQAQKLYRLLPEEGGFHLSTTMTAANRREVIDEIRRRLDNCEPCRVVSTSLIEAGVDLDFPCVYRAMAGLDSIIQAAGRCNREGRHSAGESVVHVFDTETKPPPGLRQNIAAAKETIGLYEDMASPQAVEAYFHFLLYGLMGEAARDEKSVMKLIHRDMAFAEVAKRFHLIEDSGFTVYVPWKGGKQPTDELLRSGPTRELTRRLGRYAVSVRERGFAALDDAGAIFRVAENAGVLTNMKLYDEHTGLSLSAQSGEAMILE